MDAPRLISGEPSGRPTGEPSSSVATVTVTKAGGAPDVRAGGGAQTMCRLAEAPGPRERPPAWPAVWIMCFNHSKWLEPDHLWTRSFLIMHCLTE